MRNQSSILEDFHRAKSDRRLHASLYFPPDIPRARRDQIASVVFGPGNAKGQFSLFLKKVGALNLIVRELGVRKVKFSEDQIRDKSDRLISAELRCEPFASIRDGLFMPDRASRILMNNGGEPEFEIVHEGKRYVPRAKDHDARVDQTLRFLAQLVSHPEISLPAAHWTPLGEEAAPAPSTSYEDLMALWEKGDGLALCIALNILADHRFCEHYVFMPRKKIHHIDCALPGENADRFRLRAAPGAAQLTIDRFSERRRLFYRLAAPGRLDEAVVQTLREAAQRNSPLLSPRPALWTFEGSSQAKSFTPRRQRGHILSPP